MKKIYVVSEYVYSAQNSTGYFWSKVIKKLGMTFGGVNVVAPAPSQLGYVKSDVYGVEYKEFKFRAINKEHLLYRFWGQVKECFDFARVIVGCVRRGDIVVSGTNPALLLILMPVLKLFIGFRWCLLVHDVYPESMVPAGVLRKSGYFYRLLSWFFSYIYVSANHLIVIGRDMRDLLHEKTRGDVDISVIPNWVCDRDVVPQCRSESKLIDSLGWRDMVVFQFFGNIGRVQDVNNIVRAIDLVTHPRAAFLFIGDGVEVGSISRYISQHPGANVSYIGPLNQEEKNTGLAACDVALVTLAEGMLGLGVPSKAYFSMAADRPLLAVMECEAEIARMVCDESIGWTCEPSNPEMLASLIDRICEEDLSQMAGRPRNALVNNYSEAVALEKFVSCIRSVMD